MKTKSKIFFFMAALFITMIFSVVSAFAAIDEIEPNDGKENAHVIKVGTTVYGSVSDDGGDDWFKFTAPVSGTIKMTLRSESGVCLLAYDGDDNELVCIKAASSDSGVSGAYSVISGREYYLCVKNSHQYKEESINYQFTVGYDVESTTISLLKSKIRGFTVKWNKKEGSSFYQVQYTKKSSYANYRWGKAKIVKASSKASSKTVSNLAEKRKYYVRVRVARKIDGVTYYSNWSGKKSVKTDIADMKKANVKWDLKNNKTLKFKRKSRVLGVLEDTLKMTNYKVKKSKKPGYKVCTFTMTYKLKKRNITRKQIEKIFAHPKGAKEFMGSWYVTVIDFETGKCLEEKNDKDITVTFPGDWKHSGRVTTQKLPNGRYLWYHTAIKIKCKIVYPKEYKNLTIGAGGYTVSNVGNRDEPFWNGKGKFSKQKLLYSKKDKNYAHFMRVE